VRVSLCVVPTGLDMEPFGYDGELEDPDLEQQAINDLLYYVAIGAAMKSKQPDRVLVDLAERLHEGFGVWVAKALAPGRVVLGDVFTLVEK